MAIQNVRRVPIVNVNAVGDNIVVAAVPAVLSTEGRINQQPRKLRVISGKLEADGAGDMTISSGVAGGRTNLSGPMSFVAPAAGVAAQQLTIEPATDWEFGPFETKPGEALNLFTTAAMSLDGWLVIAEVV
jgi:hypothetical protein